jgi:hypothetical protein
MDAVLGKQTFIEVQVINPAHPPLIVTEKLKANQGELAAGLILAEDSNGDKVPYKKDYSQVIGTGNGTATSFSGTLTDKPVCPGSVTVTAGTVTLSDDENGNLKGTGGSGYVNYKTGDINVTFTAAPANAVNVTAAYANKPVGVLTRGVDTAKDTAGEVLCHGVVVKSNLKVGAGTPADADLKKLEPAIFAW